MNKLKMITSLILLILLSSFTGKYITKNGKVSFYSDAPLEKIEAHNSQLNAALDNETGAVFFKVLIKSFIFEKALMQEHFNENYLESDKYPTATFKGKINNLNEIDFNKEGSYPATVSGTMTIHGVSQKMKSMGTITVGQNGINVKSKFNINIADYKISIPGVVAGKIAEVVEVRVDADMKPYKK